MTTVDKVVCLESARPRMGVGCRLSRPRCSQLSPTCSSSSGVSPRPVPAAQLSKTSEHEGDRSETEPAEFVLPSEPGLFSEMEMTSPPLPWSAFLWRGVRQLAHKD